MAVNPQQVEPRYRPYAWCLGVLLCLFVFGYPLKKVFFRKEEVTEESVSSEWGAMPDVVICPQYDEEFRKGRNVSNLGESLAGPHFRGRTREAAETIDIQTHRDCLKFSMPDTTLAMYRPDPLLNSAEDDLLGSTCPSLRYSAFVEDAGFSRDTLTGQNGTALMWIRPDNKTMYQMIGVIQSHTLYFFHLAKSISSDYNGIFDDERGHIRASLINTVPWAQNEANDANDAMHEQFIDLKRIASKNMSNTSYEDMFVFVVDMQICERTVTRIRRLGVLPQLRLEASKIGGLWTLAGVCISFLCVKKFPSSTPVLAAETLTLRGNEHIGRMSADEVDKMLAKDAHLVETTDDQLNKLSVYAKE